MFERGKLTFICDASAGSSGKGRTGSYVFAKHAGGPSNLTFACNAFSCQAGHWVKLRNGKSYFYQSLNSCAYSDTYEKTYIGPAACLELPALLREIEENNVNEKKLGISPIASIVTDEDQQYERGTIGFDGDELFTKHEGTQKTGSTCHGVGSATARKILRRPSVVLVRDVPELKPFLCEVDQEILKRLDNGESGMCEIAQGFSLSLNHSRFYPHTTSRSVTVAQALADMFLPTSIAGPLIINCRTCPIRISSHKYIANDDGRHLTWAEVEAGVQHTVYQGDSGGWYPDQEEVTWEYVTRLSGSPKPIIELTSVTRLPRRVAEFSYKNLVDAIQHNQTGRQLYITLNFADYVDHTIKGVDKIVTDCRSDIITPKLQNWLVKNLRDWYPRLALIGTGPHTEDTIDLEMTFQNGDL